MFNRGPGSGTYMLPPLIGFKNHDATKYRNPAYTISGYIKPIDKRLSPGPCYGLERNFTQHGRDGIPAYTMAAHIKPLSTCRVPGPGAYWVERVPPMKEDRAPVYTMKSRTKQRPGDKIPGPNTYGLPPYIGPRIPNKTSFPAYTMTGKPIELKRDRMPGPCAYTPVSLNIFKKKYPQYTLIGRNYPPGDKSKIPGPLAYNPMYRVQTNPPRFSFGIKHSPYTTPIILPNDV
ncbi:outer dense fiber protein 3-like isoform X1 [Schistocerca gregaria]|uniref:outer dense fiber protein 3-like isoform X1 n=1 Tax=Schistocerca gregaria TaxID=7010 RepID=UPI00211EB4D8|nr:outer dense fiber protein 3-like isoform X1 [Schistocerca gregaria]